MKTYTLEVAIHSNDHGQMAEDVWTFSNTDPIPGAIARIAQDLLDNATKWDYADVYMNDEIIATIKSSGAIDYEA